VIVETVGLVGREHVLVPLDGTEASSTRALAVADGRADRPRSRSMPVRAWRANRSRADEWNMRAGRQTGRGRIGVKWRIRRVDACAERHPDSVLCVTDQRAATNDDQTVVFTRRQGSKHHSEDDG
jgi:hypothetical protein